jgi:hypothetical protein
MVVTTLDTHAMVKQLLAVGFTDQQAEALTDALRSAQNIDLSDLATRHDLEVTKRDLEIGLANVEAKIAETKAGVLKWMVSAIGLQTVAILGAAIALVHTAGR